MSSFTYSVAPDETTASALERLGFVLRKRDTPLRGRMVVRVSDDVTVAHVRTVDDTNAWIAGGCLPQEVLS